MPIIKRQDMNRREGMTLGLEVCQIADSDHGTQSLTIGELTLAPNTRVPRHAHANTEEAMVVIEGTLDAVLGRERGTVGPGDTILAPAGAIHGFVNRYDAPARILFIYPIHNPDMMTAGAENAPSGFPETQGLTGYSSPQHRPLDSR